MQKQNGFVQILVIALVVLVAAALGLYYYVGMKPASVAPVNTSIAPRYQGDYQQGVGSVAPIKNTADLNSVSGGLDAMDTTQIDAELNKLNADSSTF